MGRRSMAAANQRRPSIGCLAVAVGLTLITAAGTVTLGLYAWHLYKLLVLNR